MRHLSETVAEGFSPAAKGAIIGATVAGIRHGSKSGRSSGGRNETGGSLLDWLFDMIDSRKSKREVKEIFATVERLKGDRDIQKFIADNDIWGQNYWQWEWHEVLDPKLTEKELEYKDKIDPYLFLDK